MVVMVLVAGIVTVTITRAAAGNAAIPELQLRNAAATYQTENLAISLSVLILYSKIYKCAPPPLTIILSIGID